MADRKKNRNDPVAYPSLFFRRKDELEDFFATNRMPDLQTARPSNEILAVETAGTRNTKGRKLVTAKNRPMSGRPQPTNSKKLADQPLFQEVVSSKGMRPMTAKANSGNPIRFISIDSVYGNISSLF